MYVYIYTTLVIYTWIPTPISPPSIHPSSSFFHSFSVSHLTLFFVPFYNPLDRARHPHTVSFYNCPVPVSGQHTFGSACTSHNKRIRVSKMHASSTAQLVQRRRVVAPPDYAHNCWIGGSLCTRLATGSAAPCCPKPPFFLSLSLIFHTEKKKKRKPHTR